MAIAKATNTNILTDTIANTINYLDEMLHGAADGPAKSSMIDDHCATLTKTIVGLKFDLLDATSALKLTRGHSTMLGAENVERLRLAISRSSEVVLKHSSKREIMVPDYQEHNHIEEYLTEAMWTMLKSDQQFETKMSAMAEFIVDTVGVHYPRELSYTSIVGVIILPLSLSV